jgi:hypothetical protein
MVAQDAAVAPECPSPNNSRQHREFSSVSQSAGLGGFLGKIGAKKFGSAAEPSLKPK